MSEKLRNENMGESQRETIQKDVQSPSVSSFDQKKEFFEHVLQEEVPKQEINTEQKKDVIDDLQTIVQNQEGKSFDEKKEFFENIGEVKDDEKVDEKVGDTSRVSESQEKLSPTQEWRSKYEGPTQSPLGFEGSDIGSKDRSSQSQVLGSQQKGSSVGSESLSSQKDTSFGSDVPSSQQRSPQSQDWSNQQDTKQKDTQKDTSFGSDVPLSQQRSPQSQDWSNQQDTKQKDTQKDTSFGSDLSSPQQGSSGTTQSQDWSNQQKGSSIGSESLSSQKDTSFGSDVPSSQQRSPQFRDWSNQQDTKQKDTQKDTSFGSDLSSPQQGSSLGTTQSQDWSNQQKGSSIGSESLSSQKDTSFGSDVPSTQQGSSFGTTQSQDWSNQQDTKQQGTSQKDTSFGSDLSSSQSQVLGSQQKGSSIGSESLSSQKDSSFGSDLSSKQKKEGFSAFFPKEGSTQQEGDLISFGSEDLSNQSQKGQETSLGSVISTLPQEIQGTTDLSNKDDKKMKSKRKKGFEPKDPLQKTNDVSNESGIEKK